MPGAPRSKDELVLSYLALRKAVGIVALGLPFLLAIPWWFIGQHAFASSISSYYYTGVRNFLEGPLCAIALFMGCCRGYDRDGEMAGIISAVCALGVAFFPTAPDKCASHGQQQIGHVHYFFAASLFVTLAVFCLVLFKRTADKLTVTLNKRRRNKVYTVCGWGIIGSLVLIIVCGCLGIKHLVGPVSPMFCFETTSLLFFGTAWLTKGETFLKDATL
jgi:hypothetical protein